MHRKSGENTNHASRKKVQEPTTLHISTNLPFLPIKSPAKDLDSLGDMTYLYKSILAGGWGAKTLSGSEMTLSVPGHHKQLAN